jgi:flagellar motility protein MotE (MotC chaperone)
MSGTDVAQKPPEETAGEEQPTKRGGNFRAFLKIWLPFPVILGALLFFQFKTGNLGKSEPPPEEETGVFEGAGSGLPILLQALQEERAALQQDWEDLRFAERRIFLEQGEIEERKEEVQTLLTRVEAKVQVMEEERDRMLGQLARVYETMKPDAAAEILSGVDVETSTEIIRRMKERAAAQVMASLEPKAAARISQRMLRIP